MTSMLYARQATLPLEIPKEAVVVGVGGVGTWIALQCAMLGVPNLTLIDGDVIELHNLNRLPYPESAVGRSKVCECERLIKQLRPKCNVTSLVYPLTSFTLPFLEKAEVVFDTTDREDIHKLIEEHWSRTRVYTLIRASYDGEHFTIAKNARLSTEGWELDSQSGYRVVPSFVGIAQLVASLAVWLACTPKINSTILSASLEELFRSRGEKQ